ncbi:rhomboid family intramembrane serine protease [Sorangium sp. So ce375]|uniref:rhomboid family intramembrane serine protease n=1 Tax=Sorangium sp. So ce375 TaxID=3133306 RepID=UPI003F5BE8E7
MGEQNRVCVRDAVGAPFVPIAILPPARGERAAMIQNGDASSGEAENHGPGLTAIGPVMPERKVREWALVLQSSELWHAVRYTTAGWVILVRDEDYALAASSIDRYEAENRNWPPVRPRERLRHPPSAIAGAAFAALALFFFLVTGPASGGGRWFQRGASVANLVVGPEPWRAITALTLHADSAHVIGNVISGTVFASAVQRRLGPGGAALAVVASGAIGNFANALWHHSMGQQHASIGASTAVFGAIGLLAATQLVLDRAHDKDSGAKRPLLHLVAPLVGGLALLGALGASPRSDLGAHAFGLLSGAAIGLVAGLPLRNRPAPRRPVVQVALGAIAAALVVGAWQLALIT